MKDALGNVLSVGDQVALCTMAEGIVVGVITSFTASLVPYVCVTYKGTGDCQKSVRRFKDEVVKVFQGGLV